MSDKKRTPLFDWHEANGGNMVEFGDYVMPLWYGSAKNEHMAVVTGAGIFDTSHMAAVLVDGPGAFDLLQWCFTRDLNACVGKESAPITPGKCVYGAFLNERGESVDDGIVYKVHDEQYVVVINAGMGGIIAKHLEANAAGKAARCTDLTDKLGKIDIQGPSAVKIMGKVIKDPQETLAKLPYFSFKGHFDKGAPSAAQAQLLDGTPLLLSRSGYTGEVGFEIFVERAHNRKVWEALLAAGAPLGLTACGLASRDSLRTGAVLPLSHQDIGAWTYINHPWPFALPFDASGKKFTKRFLGADVIERAAPTAPWTLAFVGGDLRKVDSHEAVVLDKQGREIGRVLTCVTDMAIGRHEGRIYSTATPDKPADLKIKGLSCGFVRVDAFLPQGTVVQLQDSKRTIEVAIETDVRPDRTARKALKAFL